LDIKPRRRNDYPCRSENRRVIATIQVGKPGTGGDIGYGAGSVWATAFEIPLTRIEANTNNVVKQWVGKGRGLFALWFRFTLDNGLQKALPSRIPIEVR
jgi:hypothetical protein